ncbi:hypothetical protein Tsubulata_049870 [Turnera subulata]|uniref:Uncharacterized protein n=1 Tax=Turnera subulata TaxID=218843 RepID=A0A9Q0FWS7_9ROSI|nr:hypothetical protein Tsubulata_049870 [Turnera subulata]
MYPLVQLIATAALFLAAKSEETPPRPLNNVLRVSCEILHQQDITLLSYMLLPGTHLTSVIAADRLGQFEKLEYTEDDYPKELEHMEQKNYWTSIFIVSVFCYDLMNIEGFIPAVMLIGGTVQLRNYKC